MIFKGLADRFQANATKIYNEFSLKTSNDTQPFLEFKPDDPNRDEADNDTFEVPAGSFSRDLTRIERFLGSDDGKLFLVKQAELQTGNTFSETRFYNPVFPFGKILLNGDNIQRPLSTALDEEGGEGASDSISGAIGSFVQGFVQGSTSLDSNQRSPGSIGVGGAGRLQKETETSVINHVLGQAGPSGLLNLLPPNILTRTLSAIQSVLDDGILDTNERPELNVNGQFYSILLWEGFNRMAPQTNQFFKAGQDLRSGNIENSILDIGSGIVQSVSNALLGSAAPTPTGPLAGRDDPLNTNLAGLRYFITDEENADKYIMTTDLSFFDRQPYMLSGNPVDSTITVTNVVNTAIQNASKIQSQTNSFFGTIGGYIKTASSFLLGNNTPIASALSSISTDLIDTASDNPAETGMLFNALSLHNRYLNDTTLTSGISSVGGTRDAIDTQINSGLDAVQVLMQNAKLHSLPNLGYVGGLVIGQDAAQGDLEGFTRKNVKAPDGRYYHDGALDRGATPIYANQNSSATGAPTAVDAALKQTINAQLGDSIDFIFHDFVNNKVLPFRAMLNEITETISPEYESHKYVGRTERNIVYAGSIRELAFSFFVQASAQGELDYIWQKINYLTGLCFPSTFSSGFMVPPFVQLTIGNYYVDQPGYIKSLTYSIDENTSWDIESDKQIPMGIHANVNFSVIEKTQVSTGVSFYGFAPSTMTTN